MTKKYRVHVVSIQLGFDKKSELQAFNIEIRPSGSLEGNIQCARLIVEEGGIFRGKCNI